MVVFSSYMGVFSSYMGFFPHIWGFFPHGGFSLYKILKHFAFGGNSSIPSFHCGAKESPRAHFGERMDQTRTLFLPDKEICFLSARIVYLYPSCYADRVLSRQKKIRSYSGTECLCVIVYQLKYVLAGL